MFREWGNVTENYLNKEVLPLLQKLMRIQDWDIEVFLIHKFEMGYISGNPNNVGHCVRHRLTNLAYIHY